MALPELFNYAAASLELAGAAALILSLAVYPVAVLLAILLVPATFLSRGLLVPEHPSMLIHVFRDLAIAGGLLLVAGLHRRDRNGQFADVRPEGSSTGGPVEEPAGES